MFFLQQENVIYILFTLSIILVFVRENYSSDFPVPVFLQAVHSDLILQLIGSFSPSLLFKVD